MSNPCQTNGDGADPAERYRVRLFVEETRTYQGLSGPCNSKSDCSI